LAPIFLLAIALVMSSPSHSSASPYSLGEAASFGILALEGGNLIINSSTQLIGDVGYSSGVTSTINQKAEDFTGGAYVHSGVNAFDYTDKNFFPSDGILTGPAVDARLDQANLDALSLATFLNGQPATHTFGALGDDMDLFVASTGAFNIVDIASIDYKSDSINLTSRVGLEDFFVLRISGNFGFDQSAVNLNGITAENVLFYFPNTSTVNINKANTTFRGTILAPTSTVEYHNPAVFEGAIIAKNINVHSDFNLTHVPLIPEPSSVLLVSLSSLLLFRRRR
jgi:choice-of-anchor A domain-containing protein